MKKLKKPLALLLALSLIFSLSITGFAAAAAAAAVEDNDDLTTISDEEENSEKDSSVSVDVASADELKTAMESTDYSGYDTLIIHLTCNITMESTDTINGWSHSNIVIDGKKNDEQAENEQEQESESDESNWYTLTGPEGTDRQYSMFTAPSSGLTIVGKALTFRNINIDANKQNFIYYSGNNANGASFALNNVCLINLCGNGSSAPIDLEGKSANPIGGLSLDNVTTMNCTGSLIHAEYFGTDGLSIRNSKLETTAGSGSFDYVISVRYTVGTPLTIDQSSIIYTDTENTYVYGIYNRSGYWDVTLKNESSILGTNYSNTTSAYFGGSNGGELILNDCTIKNTDGTRANINLNGSAVPLTVKGEVKGSPEIVLTNGTPVTLATSLAPSSESSEEEERDPIYYSFNSGISNSDVVVAQSNGTEGDEDYYALTTDDLEYLVYTDEDSIRSLELNEENGKAYLNRVDIANCEVEMDTTTVTPVNTASDGSPVFQRTVSDEALTPDVTVTLGDRELSSSGYYSVTYSGDTSIPADENDSSKPRDEDGTVYDAKITVTPTGDLKGDNVELPYHLLLGDTVTLTTDNTKTVLTYEDGIYDTEVTYYETDEDGNLILTKTDDDGETVDAGIALEEGTDYKVVYTVNGDTYTVTAAVTGVGLYIGSYDAVFDLPGKRTVKDEETLNQALQDRVAYIEFGESFGLDSSVTVDYDVVLDGKGFTLYADGLTITTESRVAMLEVTSGNVILTDLTVDGRDQTRPLYIGDDAAMTVTGGSVVQNGGTVVYGSGPSGEMIMISEGGTLTLGDCVVEHANASHDIFNLGTLNVQEGAYLHDLTGKNDAIYNSANAVINWTGGIFDTDVIGSYQNASMQNGYYSGTVIENRGVFNMSSGEINGYLLDENTGKHTYDENGNYTGEQTTVVTGAVHVTQTGEFNLSGDALITGFCSTGFGEGFVRDLPSGGGGVYNDGIFNMTGGAITGNAAEAAGGGVYNGGVFYMTGGVIVNNKAVIGAGVYNDYARDYSGQKSTTVLGQYPAGEFYMTGGEISDNHLTGEGIIENTEQNDGGMMGDSTVSIENVGSELYVSGGCTVVVSGGTIIGTEKSSVALYDEDGEETGETTKIGSAIALVPSSTIHAMQTDGVISERGYATMTITGSPEIAGGVTLINYDSVIQPVTVTNLSELADLANQGLVDLSDWTVYEWTADEESTENYTASWLLLDGGLNVEDPLDITTLTVDSYEIEFGISMTSNNYIDGHTESTIKLNCDNDIVAEYLDRVTPDESDGIGDGAMMSMTTSDGVNLLSQIYVDQDIPYSVEVSSGQTSRTYDTEYDHVAFEGWIVCSHPNGLVECASTESCTEEGCVAHYECPDCGKVFVWNGTYDTNTGDPVIVETVKSAIVSEPLGHDPEFLEAADPTCTEDGNIACYVCTRCGAYLADDGTFSTVLTYEEITDGYTLVAAGHEWELVDGQLPTCGETDGWTAGVQCKVCGEVLLGLEPIEAGEGHDLEAKIEGSQVLYWVCTRCGQLFADAEGTIPYVPEGGSSGSDEESGEPACEHDWIYTPGTPATCVDDGVADKYECSICGEVIGGETIKATGVHNMYSVAAQSATCTSDGHLAYQVCLNCLQFFTVNGTATTWDQLVVPAGHTLTYVSAKDATETTDGYIAHYECSVCGRYFSDAAGTKELSKTEITVAATGTSSGSVSASASASASAGSGNGSGSSSSSASSGKSGGSSSSSSSSSGSSGSSTSSGSSSSGTSSGSSTDNTLSSGTGTVRIASSGSSSGSSGSSGSSSGSSGVSVRSSSSSDEDADEDEETKSEKASSEDDAEESDERRSASVQDHTALNAKMYFDYEDLMNATDLALYNAGSSVSFSLSLNDLDEDDLDEDTAETMKSAYAETGSLISAHYLEIELIEKLDDMDISLSQTPGEIVIELAVPEEMLDQIAGTDGSFYVVRVHDGAADLLDAEFDSATDTVTFRTDKFSTFGLVYLEPLVLTEEEETAPEEEPLASDFEESVVEEEESGGHAWVVWMIIAIVVVVVAAIVVAVVLRQKKQTAKKV